MNMLVHSCFYLLLLLHVKNSLNVIVRTRIGDVKGTERKSRDGNVYHAFTKIPYAKPPVGRLRLKNPVEAEPWNGTLEATQEAPRCLQLKAYSLTSDGTTRGQEDCLYLNIYTPQLGSSKKLPVLVYIHGGGFRGGSTGSKNGADYFMDEKVVLASLHYRLGLLGFLSAEDATIPGNFGLKDQAMALQWIHKHIDSFGGDPDQLTMFGGSSGAICTHYHMMSPLSKNLIKGAISQSGVVNKFWGYTRPGEARFYAKEVARVVGCTDKEDQELLKCLQLVPYKKLVNAASYFIDPVVNTTLTFRPVREIEGDGAFLPFDPTTKETNLPWITGVVTNDGLLAYGTPLIQDPEVTQKFIENIDEVLPRILYLNNRFALPAIKDKYFSQPLNIQSTKEESLKLYGDFLFINTMGEAIKRHKGPLFQYYFDYRGANSFMDKSGVFTYGVAHGDEILSLLNWTDRFPKHNAEDEKMSRLLVKMWANFARKQNPSIEGEVIWPDRKSKEFLHIKQPLTVELNLKEDVINWWSKVLL